MEHILVVEDDASIAEWISDYLTGHGFEVSVANRGDVAVELISEDMPDLVLLDIMLPEKNGFDVCKEVRTFYQAPILMITACGEEADEVKGLEFGADDYVTKPVRLQALLARIKALLRRDKATNDALRILNYGNARIDSLSRTITINDIEVALSSADFDLIWQLATHAGAVVSREELIRQLRGLDYDGFDRTIDNRVSRLRKKIDNLIDCPFKIETIWGKGYQFVTHV